MVQLRARVLCLPHKPSGRPWSFQCPLWVSEQNVLLQTAGLPLCHCSCYSASAQLLDRLWLCSLSPGKTRMRCGEYDSPSDTNTHQAASVCEGKCSAREDWTWLMRLSLLAQWGFILSKHWPVVLLQSINIMQKRITLFNDMLLSCDGLQA